MSFEKFLDEEARKAGFGKERYVRNFKERQNLSKLRLDSDSGCEYIDANGVYFGSYDEVGKRYAACVNLVYDAMLAVFDQSTRRALICRFNEFRKEDMARLSKYMREFGANSEARLIGLQNGQQFDIVEMAYALISSRGIGIFEIDLFGNEQRHVAIDLKTGVTFDVLMLNRPYKPGELVNKQTKEQFERSSISAVQNGEKQRDKNETNQAKNL